MVALKKFNLDGQEVGTVEVSNEFAEATCHLQLIKDYIVALRANARQWSANTKTRSEVAHSTKKPHPQKGGGRSRQGSLAAPHYKGGGRVFGPKPKFGVRKEMNQKEKRQAILFLMAEKIREGRLVVLDSFVMNEPKTQVISKFLKQHAKGTRPLFLMEGAYQTIESEGKKNVISVRSSQGENMKLSLRNIPNSEFRLAADASGYDIMVAHDVVITEEALKEVQNLLVGE